MTLRALAWLALLPALLAAAESTATGVANAVRTAGLNPTECYAVRDLQITRGDVRLYLTDGHLIFGKPAAGRVITAVFSAESEGNDAEVIVLPPTPAERRSLAQFTEEPNLNEHFRSAVLLFTDDTADLLREQIARSGAKRDEGMGHLLANTYDSALRNITGSFLVRMVQELLDAQPTRQGFFFATLGTRRFGAVDFVVDPQVREQVTVGQTTFRDGRTFFDIWCRYVPRSAKADAARVPPNPSPQLADIRIDAELDPQLRLRATTRGTLRPSAALRSLVFNLTRRMRVTGVRMDGQPVDFFQPESLRSGLLRGDDNDPLLVAPPAALEPGRPYAIEFDHEGTVVTRAGEKVYLVAARTNWYPRGTADFTPHELRFRCPKALQLVATGDLVEERVEGDWRIVHRKASVPIRLAGFNLGEFRQVSVRRGEHVVEAHANPGLEAALQPRLRPVMAIPVPSPFGRGARRSADVVIAPTEVPRPDPAARLQHLAEDVAGAVEFMASAFGPPPLKTLHVTPIPGALGQGFPGLLYLSTLAYLPPADLPVALRTQGHRAYFADILEAHETAHQWWGNLVGTLTPDDDWLMEALANYSALLYLEKLRGRKALESVLEGYRVRLSAKVEGDRTVESVGPVTWGVRLQQSQVPQAWQAIVYEKGSWIMHMLRHELGDRPFLAMLAELRRRHQHQLITTAQFRLLVEELAPKNQLRGFFDQWVDGTGIPTLKLEYTVKGTGTARTLVGKVIQSGVPDDFSVRVPIEIQFGRGQSVTHVVRTGSDAAAFAIPLRQPPTRVTLDPQASLLAQR